MDIRRKLAEEIVETELFYSKTTPGDIPVYVAEGFDQEKMEAEGSNWIVYQYDAINEYYQRHKESIEETIDDILKDALYESPIKKEV